jgi:hypothetical protein
MVMLITRTSLMSGLVHTKEINISNEQLTRWQNGELIQNVCPHLSISDREFIISGVTDKEWELLEDMDIEEEDEDIDEDIAF